MLKQTVKPVKLWKNQRLIDEHGLVVCQQLQRLFENHECGFLLEDLLKIYQSKGMPIHYMRYLMSPFAQQNETITYKGYVGYRCSRKDKKEGKQRVIGQFFITYKIIRLDIQKIDCIHPFLILFNVKCSEIQCKQCKESHISRITESSYYVIQTLFMSELKKKLAFMQKYPNYNFTPHNFISNTNAGEAVYEYIKDHNYEPSYYFQRCENVLVNCLKMQMMRRGMDCEAMRLDEFCELFPEERQQVPKLSKCFPNFKLKYMCRKCQPRQIWTIRDKVKIQFVILQLQPYLTKIISHNQSLEKYKLIQGSSFAEKYQSQKSAQDHRNPQKQSITTENTSHVKPSLFTLFKTEERRLDRSIHLQVKQYEQFQEEIKQYGTRYQQIEEYKLPYLILYSIKVPMMKCARCYKQKDGLIYITNLIDYAHTTLNQKLCASIGRFGIQKNEEQQN